MRRPEELTVLVVDDDPDVTLFLGSVLEDAGFRVATAGGGLEALERLRRGPLPDLISLDLVMPGHSGIRVLHDLRKHPEWSRIPVIVVSGHSREPEVRRGLDEVLADSALSGPSLYLEKPVTADSYVEAVCRVLEVDRAAESPGAGDADRLRSEVAALISGAGPDALEAALQALRAGPRRADGR